MTKRSDDSPTRRTWKIAAGVSTPVRELVFKAAEVEGTSAAAIVRRGAIKEAERVLEGGKRE